MDQQRIQSRINLGYAVAARYLGGPFEVFRPLDPMAPLAPAARLRAILCKFDRNPRLNHVQPAGFGEAEYYLLGDGTDVKPGDYIRGDEGTWYVAGMEPNVPPLCVRCNTVVSVLRPVTTLAAGVNPYGGRADATDAPLMRGWPASVLQGGVSNMARANLPGDAKQGGSVILLPAWPGVELQAGDLVSDDQGKRFVIGGAERTHLGWRLSATNAET